MPEEEKDDDDYGSGSDDGDEKVYRNMIYVMSSNYLFWFMYSLLPFQLESTAFEVLHGASDKVCYVVVFYSIF